MAGQFFLKYKKGFTIMRHHLSRLLLCCAISGAALADSPLPAPELITICSASDKFCASSDPATLMTSIRAKGSQKTVWSIKGWHRNFTISDDGQSLVIGHSGGNLVPMDVTLKEPMLSFYQREKLIRVVTLGDFFKSKTELRPTASHLAWGYMTGIDRNNRISVELINKKHITFNAKTGLLVKNK
jgi:hypothetical protein